MAVAFGGIETTNWVYHQPPTEGGIYTATVNKPSGLSVGDMLLASCTQYTASGGDPLVSFSTPSGWTLLESQAHEPNEKVRQEIFYKIADSSDSSATDFDFTIDKPSSAHYSEIRVSLSYFTGVANVNPLSNIAVGTESGSYTYTFANSVTPVAGGMLVFSGAFADPSASVTDITNYSVATNNPTWTERDEEYDSSGTVTADGLMVLATGARSATTATGDSSVSSDNQYESRVGALIFIYEPTDASGTTNLQTTTTTTTQMVGKAGTNGTADMTAANTTTYDIGGEGEADIWTNQNRSSTTWPNQNKS